MEMLSNPLGASSESFFQSKKRSSVVAFLLSVVQVGLGQVYNGQIGKALLLLGILYTIFFSMLWLPLLDSPYGLLGLVLLAVPLWIWQINDAGNVARRNAGLSWPRYKRGVFCLLWLFAVSTARYQVGPTLREHYEAFRIPAGSMMPTLLIGDHIMVDKTYYQNHRPERGDLVILRLPDLLETDEDESSITIIKRVIGLGGEIVSVKNDKVYINGHALDEPYAIWTSGGSKAGEFAEQAIPKDHLFLLGDNRDHSRDSRFWKEPFLAESNLEGKALYVYWSWQGLERFGLRL